MDENNDSIQTRRWLDPSKITVKMKDEEEKTDEEETKTTLNKDIDGI